MFSTCLVSVLRKKISFPERSGNREGNDGWRLAHLFLSPDTWWEETRGQFPVWLSRAVRLLRPPAPSPSSLLLSSKQNGDKEMQRWALTSYILYQVGSEPCMCADHLMPRHSCVAVLGYSPPLQKGKTKAWRGEAILSRERRFKPSCCL